MSRRAPSSSDESDDDGKGGKKPQGKSTGPAKKKTRIQDRTKLEVKCGPKPVAARTRQQQKELQKLRENTEEAFDTTQDPSASQSEKKKAVEEIGTEGAKTALRIEEEKEIDDDEIEEFEASGVVDAYHPDSDTILEAKGGSSKLGGRKTSRGKRAQQCSPAYNEDIRENMAQSNYEGNHPSVGCDKHEKKPDGDCQNCQRAERAKRRETGKQMKKAAAKGTLKKAIVRTEYDETGVKDPEVTEVTVV